jgi:4-aminobutyrate aminotransferase
MRSSGLLRQFGGGASQSRCTVTQAPDKLVSAPVVPHIITELPGPKARAHVEFDKQWTSPSVPRAYPVVPVRGRGCTIEDIDGNLFLDFNAGIAVTSTGHCHPEVVRRIQEQAGQLIHYSADFYIPVYAEMCAELARIAPMKEKCRVFLGNSGTEAVEGAIKLARFATRRQNIVAFLGAFHGRTYGSVSLTASKAKYHAGFGPMLPGVYHAPFGHVADLKWFDDVLFKHLMPPDEIAAIILEPIQGEGGYLVPEDGFIQGLRKICDQHGIVLISDEVQAGAGRTGKMWSIQNWDVEPDIVATAKGIASGMPLSAFIARDSLMTKWGPGAHGTTYGGNPLACVAALETIKQLEGGLMANATARGAQLMTGLKELQARYPGLVKDARGIGLMIGVEFDTHDHAAAVEWASFQRGVLALEAGNTVVRISPPLVLTEAEAAIGLKLFGEAVAEVAAKG